LSVKRTVFEIFDFKKCSDLDRENHVRVRQDHHAIERIRLPIDVL